MEYLSTIWLTKYFKPPFEAYYSERKKKKEREEKLLFQIQLLIDIQARFRKGRGTRDQIPNIRWIIEKARDFQKTSTPALLTTPKPLTMWITMHSGKFLKTWEYQTTWPASSEICMQVKKQELELDMEQHTGSKLGKEYVKAGYCLLAYLTYMHSKS